MMIVCSHVPNEFGQGIVVPVVKDKSGDVTKLSNYRGITLSSCVSKLFEMCLLNKCTKYLYSSDLQCGFKKKLGCRNAIYALRVVTEYYVKHGSTVNICSVDMSKAFDRVNHCVLFMKLMKRRVPVIIIKLLRNWYSKCVAMVRWGGAYSKLFRVLSGVRQGGVMSPVLFAVYVNDILCKLQGSGLGCAIEGLYVGALMYADDLILLTVSLTMLQKMLSMIDIEMKYLDMEFNVTKSMILRVGAKFAHKCEKLLINNNEIRYVSKLKYLGIFIVAARRFKVSFGEARLKFFKAFNGLLAKCKGSMNDIVTFHLCKAYCKPFLTYCCESLQLLRSEFMQLQYVWHSVYNKLFFTYDVDLISIISEMLGEKSLLDEINIQKRNFLCGLNKSNNIVMRELFDLFGTYELRSL
jgi:hypothetical protein